MTCVAALVHNDRVFMGGDSASTDGSDLIIRDDEKVFFNGEYLIGCAGSFRVRDIARYGFSPPIWDHISDIMQLMTVRFIGSLRQALTDQGVEMKDGDDDPGSAMLVAIDGYLFRIESDFQVGISIDGYDAVGSGAGPARGALFATKRYGPKHRITSALEAAQRHSAGVREPFHILSTGEA